MMSSGETDSSRQTVAPDGAQVWIVMQWRPNTGLFEFQGVFGDIPSAVQACLSPYYCCCPATIGEVIGDDLQEWPGCWYPVTGNHGTDKPQEVNDNEN